MNCYIKHISAIETHTVRHPVLRAGKPIESCIFEGDDLNTTFHLGIFLEKKLVGVCSFFKCNHHLLSQALQYQLRGMAVLNQHQSLGLGNLMLSHGEHLLKEQNVQIIWCNAREKAVNFYKKLDYTIIGEPFHINDIGLHHIMYKNL